MDIPQQIENNQRRIGVIAGAGDLPIRLLKACDNQNIESFVVAFEGHADPMTVQGRAHLWARLGAAGTVIKSLKEHDVTDVVLVGAIRRPSFSEIFPDAKALDFFAKAGLKALCGDDAILQALRSFIENEGFRVCGVQSIASELLMPQGVIGRHKPTKGHFSDIERGLLVSQTLGKLDVGQSVIVQQGLVLGVEAIEGTDQLIERSSVVRRKGRGGVLIKTCKPQQDRDLDLPTIGLETIKRAHNAGLAGVAVHAHNALLLNKDEVIEYANAHKLFVVGVDVDHDL